MTLEEALSKEKLQGIADIVVDFWGPKMNSDRHDSARQEEIDQFEKRLLRSNGKLVQKSH